MRPDRYTDLSAMPPLTLPEERAYVHPGKLFFSMSPTLITTILGSCVAICLFDLESGAAGMNHYLLATRGATASPRFAETANEMLLQTFVQARIPVSRLKAKVFGGASMGMFKGDLAQRNITAAFEFLRAREIPIIVSDVGGNRGRKLHFRTTDGAAWIRLL
jgi:chemotaxis protein CheD